MGQLIEARVPHLDDAYCLLVFHCFTSSAVFVGQKEREFGVRIIFQEDDVNVVVKGGVSGCDPFNIVWKASVEIKDIAFNEFKEGSGDKIGHCSMLISFSSARGEKKQLYTPGLV